MGDPLGDLAGELAEHLRQAARAQPAEAAELAAFADLLSGRPAAPSRRRARAALTVPGLRHLPRALAALDAAPPSSLGEAATAALGHAAWSSYYARSDWSAAFVDELAVGALVGPGAPRPAEALALGLFVQGPHTVYPPHAHPAEEVYAVLTGEPAFQSGAGAPFTPRPAGSIVRHPGDVAHAIETGESPLLAVYAWRGDITGPPWYRQDMADDGQPRFHPPVVI